MNGGRGRRNRIALTRASLRAAGRSRISDGITGTTGTAVLLVVRVANGAVGASGHGRCAVIAGARICCRETYKQKSYWRDITMHIYVEVRRNHKNRTHEHTRG